jgi:hypothetical protein
MFWLALTFMLSPWVIIIISFVCTRKDDLYIKKYMK